jgi:hypothetical protein
VDPLARKYPWNSPYAFGGNRVVDAVELEGLEYVVVKHYADGSTNRVLYYTMTDEKVEALGGRPRSLFNAAPHGPLGKGVLHVHYDEQGRVKEKYEMWQKTFGERLERHGLYSGAGCVTKYENGKRVYDYTYVPIDIADAIAKKHDIDYESVEPLKRLNFLENVGTLEADIAMVKRVNKALIGMLTFRNFEIEGIDEKPVYTGFNFETLFALVGQRIFIGALATYKAWKKEGIDDGSIKPGDDFGTVGKKFLREYPLRGLLLWIAYKSNPKDKDESERVRD